METVIARIADGNKGADPPPFRAFLAQHDEQGTLFFAVELYTDEGGPGGEPPLTGRDGIRIHVR